MINPKIYNINLDMKNSIYTSNIKVKQGDIDSNVFKLKLIQDNQAYDLTGLTAIAYFTRPDKTSSLLNGVITSAATGEMEVVLTNQILNVSGYATCEIKVIGTAGEVLSTMEFGFIILKSVDYTQIESSNEFNALVSALADVSNLEGNYAPRLGSVESQLADTVTKADTASLKADAMASGSPKGVYTTLALLQAAYPTGTTGAYLVTADGKWYYWSGSAWTIGGVYQASSFPEVTDIRIGDDGVTYANAGGAVRAQFNKLKKDINSVITRSVNLLPVTRTELTFSGVTSVYDDGVMTLSGVSTGTGGRTQKKSGSVYIAKRNIHHQGLSIQSR